LPTRRFQLFSASVPVRKEEGKKEGGREGVSKGKGGRAGGI